MKLYEVTSYTKYLNETLKYWYTTRVKAEAKAIEIAYEKHHAASIREIETED